LRGGAYWRARARAEGRAQFSAMGKQVGAASLEMKATNWKLGYHLSDYSDSTWSSATSEQFTGAQNSQRTRAIRPKPSADGLHARSMLSKEAREGVFRTESMGYDAQHSTLSTMYERRAPVCDRLSAGKTNYSLAHGGDGGTGFTPTTAAVYLDPGREALSAPRREKKNYDRPAPRDPAGFAFNIVTGKLARKLTKIKID
jgi:hypothetical protein